MKLLNEILSKIEKIDYSLSEETQARLDNLTKPVGSLGKLESLAKQVVEITRVKNPQLLNKVIFTMAGDHGVTDEGISLFSKDVTPQMVYNFLEGGAGINVLARHVGARVVVVDMGVAEDLKPNPQLVIKKVGYGTKNMVKGPAMTREQAIQSIENGIEVFEKEYARGIDIVGTGEMGIGNTTPSSAIASVITGIAVKAVTGRGTGIDDKSLDNKIEIIKKAIEINHPNPEDGIDVLSKVKISDEVSTRIEKLVESEIAKFEKPEVVKGEIKPEKKEINVDKTKDRIFELIDHRKETRGQDKAKAGRTIRGLIKDLNSQGVIADFELSTNKFRIGGEVQSKPRIVTKPEKIEDVKIEHEKAKTPFKDLTNSLFISI